MKIVSALTILSACAGGFAQGADVRVQKAGAEWRLVVDGKPFFAKGVGCNQATGEQGEDYFKMAKEMGANAVRSWGGTTRADLDHAHHLKLKMIVGFWLNAVRPPTPESYQDPERCHLLKNEILEGIRSMKRHPAVLAWLVGMEVFSHTEDPAEKRAFGKFLKDVIDSIHKEDPRHPVLYSTSDETDLPDLTAFVPNVDIIGIDTYGALGGPLGWMDRHRMDKPAIITEFGPHGAWDAQKDKNGMPFDPSDSLKASDYEATWRQIVAEKGRCIGGFAFVLGEPRNQDSVTWFNINDGTLRRKAYWALHHLYTGRKSPHPVPSLSEFTIEPRGDLSAGQRFLVKATASAAGGDKLKYNFAIAAIFSDPLIVDKPRYLVTEEQDTAPGSASLKAPDRPGIYRVYVRVIDAHGNVDVADRSIKVVGRAAGR